mmetsp:Transcript_56900/g.139651  ORF Transcript_56900/g.139651 Transcript_56900/m.139651 type:complete len:221 (-) Transcript_56900:2869-3531(-)
MRNAVRCATLARSGRTLSRIFLDPAPLWVSKPSRHSICHRSVGLPPLSCSASNCSLTSSCTSLTYVAKKVLDQLSKSVEKYCLLSLFTISLKRFCDSCLKMSSWVSTAIFLRKVLSAWEKYNVGAMQDSALASTVLASSELNPSACIILFMNERSTSFASSRKVPCAASLPPRTPSDSFFINLLNHESVSALQVIFMTVLSSSSTLDVQSGEACLGRQRV